MKRSGQISEIVIKDCRYVHDLNGKKTHHIKNVVEIAKIANKLHVSEF